MVAQESDLGITRQTSPSAPIQLVTIPGAYHAFDNPRYQVPLRYIGHLLEYDPTALQLAVAPIRDFLRKQMRGP